MLDKQYALSAVDYLKQNKGILFDPGLSDSKIQAIEHKLSFNFPPDLRLLLQTALPFSPRFPNWRLYEEVPLEADFTWIVGEWKLGNSLYWPAQGICFDIEDNNFWMEDEWGVRPSSVEDACRIARQTIAQYPTLIPIFAHRYIPDEPLLADNPMFSVHQTDIIYYGADLPSYLAAEFGVPNPYPVNAPRNIKFWSSFC